MTSKSNILLIVEGGKTEPRFFRRMAEVFGLDCEIYCFSTNIYSLYKRMKEYDFDVDIKEILKKEHRDQGDVLAQKFAYTYLVFDCDLHHPKKQEARDLPNLVAENIEALQEMAEYFTNETDPSIGKLYINYPMMESYRDADDFFEDGFAQRYIPLAQSAFYKQEVAKRKLCKIHMSQYGEKEFSKLLLQNLYKWNSTTHGIWGKPRYDLYLQGTANFALLKKQKELSLKQGCLSVINTSLFLILDYYGNKEGFYDRLALPQSI